VFDELEPWKINIAALPVVACDGTVRVAVTNASVEFVATDALKRWSTFAASEVVGVNVNSALVPVVDNW
jgi:hypothetical protein